MRSVAQSLMSSLVFSTARLESFMSFSSRLKLFSNDRVSLFSTCSATWYSLNSTMGGTTTPAAACGFPFAQLEGGDAAQRIVCRKTWSVNTSQVVTRCNSKQARLTDTDKRLRKLDARPSLRHEAKAHARTCRAAERTVLAVLRPCKSHPRRAGCGAQRKRTSAPDARSGERRTRRTMFVISEATRRRRRQQQQQSAPKVCACSECRPRTATSSVPTGARINPAEVKHRCDVAHAWQSTHALRRAPTSHNARAQASLAARATLNRTRFPDRRCARAPCKATANETAGADGARRRTAARCLHQARRLQTKYTA